MKGNTQFRAALGEDIARLILLAETTALYCTLRSLRLLLREERARWN
jgi:hypothetical protein